MIGAKTPERAAGAWRKPVLLGLLVLLAPWSGCHYARQMDSSLREAEERSLAATARTLAVELAGRTDLLYRNATWARIAPSSPLDVQPILLRSAPQLEGYAGDWPPVSHGWLAINQGADQLHLLTGVYERMLYVLVDVRDPHVVFDSPDADPLDPGGFGDRIWLGFDAADGAQHQVYISSIGPGPVTARRIEPRGFDEAAAVDEPRIVGTWRLTSEGYRVALRVPLSMLNAHFGVLVDERGERGGDARSFGTLDVDSLTAHGRLILAAPELDPFLARITGPGIRIRVLTPSGAPLAQADQLGVPIPLATRSHGPLANLYRRLLERRADRQLVSATVPIPGSKPGAPIGLIEVSETPERWLPAWDAAVTRVLGVTALVSLVLFLAVLALPAPRA